MPARLSDLLTFRGNREPLPVTFGFNFLSYQRKSIGIFVALISFSSLANADCSEALVKQLLDNKFSPTQIVELCGKVSSQPSVVITTEVKPTPDAKAAAEPKPATVPKAEAVPKVAADAKAEAVPKVAADAKVAAAGNTKS